MHQATSIPDVKDVSGGHSRGMDVIARLMQEDLEVTHNGIGSLPPSPNTTRLGHLDPPLTSRTHTMVHIYAKWKLGYM